MTSHVIEITGVSEELLKLIDARVQARRAASRSEYVLELIRSDVSSTEIPGDAPTPDMTFREILAPLHQETRSSGYSDEELNSLLEQVRQDAYEDRQQLSPEGKRAG